MGSNFDFLAEAWPDLHLLGSTAEMRLGADACGCALTLKELAQRVADHVAVLEKVWIPRDTDMSGKLKLLTRQKLLPDPVDEMIFALRRAGTDAAHGGEISGEHGETLLRLAFHLTLWLHRVYRDGELAEPEFTFTRDGLCPENFDDTVRERIARIEVLPAPSAPEQPLPEPGSQRQRRAGETAGRLALTDGEKALLAGQQVRLEVSALSVVNYALQQNRVPILSRVTLINRSEKSVEDVDLYISASPRLCLPVTKRIGFVGPGSSFDVKELKLSLDPEFLAGLTEKTAGLLRFSLMKDDTVLYTEDVEITALSFDEWHGYSYHPELLAAFVTPNHPEIARLNGEAAGYLGKWTGDPSLDAYQTNDPNRVLAQAAAVYAAIRDREIVYAVPPASFERVGQRVRLCDAVLGQKLGTCLDLTLLYAACLEAAGLHPLLILKQGHIFAGVWLEDLSFPESVQDDSSLVTKRLASGVNEIAVVECTAFTAGKHMDFDRARDAAEKGLVGENPVEYIIDVNRARLSGVSPLPLRIRTEQGWHIRPAENPGPGSAAAPDEIGETIHVDPSAPEGALPKQIQWERKLLDLGLRNQLINMRLTKNTLPVLASSLDELENALASGSDFSIYPRPLDWLISDERIDFEMMHDLGSYREVIQSEFKSRRLRSVYTDTNVKRILKELYRTSRTALEENGANTLYLALGLLRWYETAKSTKPRYAPVVLVPVDIVRRSAAQGYVIRLRDDEPQMNITMLEKLKQDFKLSVSGLDPLPQDEHGIDIRRVFTILRKAVMGQPRWDVLESAYLGIFSFSQFVMWNDMRNRADDLSRSKIVRSLMDGKLSWEAGDMEIGRRVPEDHVFLPLSADASQLFAIEAACQGESFVLHGPPGTGKSQTITALIANALAQNKTVLFVAEKMAALEVVQKRLDAIGIGPFCLELHSNRSKKRDVLEQLRQATEVTKHASPESYAARAEQIGKLRGDLDAYASALHAPRKCGMTLWQLISGYEKVCHAPELRAFSPGFAASLTGADLDLSQTTVERLTAAARDVGHPQGHPLTVVGCRQYSHQIRVRLAPAVEEYLDALNALESAAGTLAGAMELPEWESCDLLQRLAAIARELTVWNDLPRAWAVQEDLESWLAQVRQMARHYLNTERCKDRMRPYWNGGFLQQSGEALLAEWNSINAKWFLPKTIGLGNLAKRMAQFQCAPIPKEELGTHFQVLAEYQEEKAKADLLLETYGRDLERWLTEKPDWQMILNKTELARQSAQRLWDITGSDQVRVRWGGVSRLRGAVADMNGAWTALDRPRTQLTQLLELRDTPAAGRWIPEQRQVCAAILEHRDELKEWITWNALAAEAESLGLGNVVEAYRAGMPHEDVMDAYRRAIYQSLAVEIIDRSPALNLFSGAVFNEKIAQFRRIDRELTELTRQEIYCRLASRVPNFAKEAAQSSEVGILQRTIRSGGRGVSLRKLFEQIPNLLPRLCPCMLMSPISAAQYLDPKREPFSLVVFDEASQLPTCKAVGALARGKEAVIVGDPKQMPPTAFFATNTVDEDNLDAEDLESILDDCLAMNMPQTHLLWHYRSRHESLIAFSNSQFYESKLYTFPSVNDRESKVRLVPVDGVFERGKNRQNRAEAEAVVEEIKRRHADPKLRGFSVGVVTFNISQQNLIDDLLTEACAADPELEKWAYGSEEPVFIKNLENVQGDERDVILFSVGYGPDEKGKVYMNFGPLNREGGWRRLNVAVSRARQEMVVFSTLTAEQIDLSRSSARGVAALKAFLEYAGGKELPLDENTGTKGRQPASGIADTICRCLEEQGYQTQQAVGHSEYRIDIAVVDPDEPERYLLGILLDGTGYGTAKTTRDREIAQISVLNGLGWEILRIWSMDWWDNSRKELERVLRELERLRREKQAERDRSEPEAAEPQPPEEEPLPLPQPQPLLGDGKPAGRKGKDPHAYEAAKLKPASVTAEDFLLPKFNAAIRSKIDQVLKTEAPIVEPLLTRRVVQSFGITRAGSRIQSRMESLYAALGLKITESHGQKVCWRADQDPQAYFGYRCSGEGENKREARDVPLAEAVNALRYVLHTQIGLPQDVLIREGAKLLGYTRLGNVVVPLLTQAMEVLESDGKAVPDTNGNWTLTELGQEETARYMA